jgi:hypothetical protein
MTRTIVFETPGLMDLRSLTLMGSSAKPNSTSPLGRFGTGLKYAVACLVRSDTPPVVFVGRNRYEFRVLAGEFRGVPVEEIELVGPFDRRTLPYTTGYGAAWESWMVYRELEANTLDEGGRTYVVDDVSSVRPSEETTRIVVPSEELIARHEARDEVFLPGATRDGGPLYSGIASGAAVEVFAPPSRYLYWRGLRVYALPKPAKRTYNVLDELALTEDRTLRDPWTAAYLVARHVQATDDERLALDALYATKDDYEEDLPYSDASEPSETVVRVWLAQPRADENAPGSSLVRRVAEHVAKANPPPARPDPFARWPRPWRRDGIAVLDASGTEVVLFTPVVGEDEATDVLDALIEAVNRDAPDDGEEVPF